MTIISLLCGESGWRTQKCCWLPRRKRKLTKADICQRSFGALYSPSPQKTRTWTFCWQWLFALLHCPLNIFWFISKADSVLPFGLFNNVLYFLYSQTFYIIVISLDILGAVHKSSHNSDNDNCSGRRGYNIFWQCFHIKFQISFPAHALRSDQNVREEG